MKKIFFIFVFSVLGIVFFQNMEVVSLQFLFWQISVPRIAVLFAAVLLGFLAGFLIGHRD